MKDRTGSDLAPGTWVLIGRLDERPCLRGLHGVIADDQSTARPGQMAVILDPLDAHHARHVRKFLGVDARMPAESLRTGWSVPTEHLIPAQRDVGTGRAAQTQFGTFGPY